MTAQRKVTTLPTVRALVGSREIALTEPGQVLPATSLVLAISGARGRTVTLDGQARWLSGGDPGLLAMDLTRSTGFHHLEVAGESTWFGTEDAKLRLDGIEAMLAELRTTGTGWTGQALFSDGQGLRDVHVVYGWLDQWAEQAVESAVAVLSAPRSAAISHRVLSRRASRGVLVAPTLRLLRSDPKRYLVSNPAGIVEVEGARYDPLRVVLGKRVRTVDTPANRRAAQLLAAIGRLADEVLQSQPSDVVATRCRLWRNMAEAALRRPLASRLAGQPSPPLVRQPEEMTERRYQRSYEIASNLALDFGWSANRSLLPRFSYVDRSDEIYQAYTAVCLAKALGLRQVDHVLRGSSRAFSGPRFDLYYDCHPHPDVLRSWRFHSDLQDTSRPDLVLHERQTDLVAVLDAKYRLGKHGWASEDSRTDVSAYMALYGVPSIAIIYPGEGPSRTVQAKGQQILEVPLRPPADLGPVIAAIESNLTPTVF